MPNPRMRMSSETVGPHRAQRPLDRVRTCRYPQSRVYESKDGHRRPGSERSWTRSGWFRSRCPAMSPSTRIQTLEFTTGDTGGIVQPSVSVAQRARDLLAESACHEGERRV